MSQPRQVMVTAVEIMPCMCTGYYKCPCGHRVTVAGCDCPRDAAIIVHCNGCGRPHKFGGGHRSELAEWKGLVKGPIT